MTREEAVNLKIFQIVRYNVTPEECDDEDFKWIIPYCGKLAIVTQKILWEDGGEEIHLRFPEKRINQYEFYNSIEELLHDFENGHDISFNDGFDIDAESIDLISY